MHKPTLKAKEALGYNSRLEDSRSPEGPPQESSKGSRSAGTSFAAMSTSCKDTRKPGWENWFSESGFASLQQLDASTALNPKP